MEEEMHMNKFEYTVTTNKSFPEAVEAVEKKGADVGFRVLHTHDLAATLAEKGFPRKPLKLIEICNAKHASRVMEKDVKLSLMLPFPSAFTFRAARRTSALCSLRR